MAIARRMGTTAPCVGLDISEPMLSAARAGRFGQRQNRSGGAQATVMNGSSPRTAPDDHSQLAAVACGAPQVRECLDRILRRTITPNRDTIRSKLSGERVGLRVGADESRGHAFGVQLR